MRFRRTTRSGSVWFVFPPMSMGLGPLRRFSASEGGSESSTVTDPGLKTFFESTGDPMVLLDPEMRIAVANRAAGRFLGMLPKHLRGTPVLEVSLLARILTAASIPQRLRGGEESPIVDDVSLTDTEGQPVQCHLEAVPLGDGRTLVHLQNTTQVLRARAQLRSVEQLHQASFEALLSGRSGVRPATSISNLVRIASLNLSRSLIVMTKEPGPPMTQSS